ncbi:MAG: hypothetical protein HEQ23_15010 [Tepidisphaera sp.]|jgi:stage IV sporulation protein FB
MGIQDRRYNPRGGGGGFGDSFRRMLESADGFFGWSFPLFRVPRWVPGIRNIDVRVHILYILILLGQLAGAAGSNGVGVARMAIWMAMLFVLVLLHEFGHCLACRLVGGSADKVLMWPLGGLAYCEPPRRWKPALITTLGGPGVNVILFPVFAAGLFAAGAGWSDVFFNPFQPGAGLSPEFYGMSWRGWLWSAHSMNLLLLAFNMLLPMFPMDAGRVVQEILWSRVGYQRSMVIAVNVGLFAAVAVGIFGIATGKSMLVGIAIFGGLTCYTERQKLAMMGESSPWSYDTDRGYSGFRVEQDSAPARPSWSERRKAKAAEKQAAQSAARDAEVDRILGKIATQGMGSLTAKEKATLDAASKAKRL